MRNERTKHFGCLCHCKEGSHIIVIDGKEYTFELRDISTKDYGYSYFEVCYKGQKIGNHQCQSDNCEQVIRKKLKKWLKNGK